MTRSSLGFAAFAWAATFSAAYGLENPTQARGKQWRRDASPPARLASELISGKAASFAAEFRGKTTAEATETVKPSGTTSPVNPSASPSEAQPGTTAARAQGKQHVRPPQSVPRTTPQAADSTLKPSEPASRSSQTEPKRDHSREIDPKISGSPPASASIVPRSPRDNVSKPKTKLK